MHKIWLFLILVFILHTLTAQNHHKRFENLDVIHYRFELNLFDKSRKIEGRTKIQFRNLGTIENCYFDLIGKADEETGMVVHSVVFKDQKIAFTHTNDQLKFELPEEINAGDTLELEIHYSGIPADGLIISGNSHGQRTFFGDNWPNRARYWLPTVDHPSDKAKLEFKVYAPAHYQVVANGYLAEKKQLKNKREFTHWKEDIPISTKLMVIGVADFTIGNKTNYKVIPVSSWVFTKDTLTGFKNYRYSTKALEYFSELIGPYPYKKLAHVQSKTRYGGMENAGCIFYHENTATSHRSQEGLFAHEVAHQWFGNSVTEQNWHHIWLSEGFATYLTHVYVQHFYGEQKFRNDLKNDRERIIRYAKQNLAAVIDTSVNDYTQLLNTNSYQKASWVLHMLRMQLGDEIFFEGLRKYYADFRDSTALTNNFRKVMESVSGQDLQRFFLQWFWQPGHPVLEVHITKDEIQIHQLQQKHLFHFSLEIEFELADGVKALRTFEIEDYKNRFPLNLKNTPVDFRLDPEIKLLFEAEDGTLQ